MGKIVVTEFVSLDGVIDGDKFKLDELWEAQLLGAGHLRRLCRRLAGARRKGRSNWPRRKPSATASRSSATSAHSGGLKNA